MPRFLARGALIASALILLFTLSNSRAYAGMNCFPAQAAGHSIEEFPALSAGEATAIISDIFGESEPDHKLKNGLLVVIRYKQVLFLQPEGDTLCLEWKPVPMATYEAARRKVFGRKL